MDGSFEQELLAFDISDSEEEISKETAREARIREAIDLGKQTYVAQLDAPYWFALSPSQRVRPGKHEEAADIDDAIVALKLEAVGDSEAMLKRLASDRRGGPELEWTMSAQYARGQLSDALHSSLAALRAQNALPDVSRFSTDDLCPVLRAHVSFPTTQPRLASKVNVRDALDLALRAAHHLVACGQSVDRTSCIQLLLLVRHEAMGWYEYQNPSTWAESSIAGSDSNPSDDPTSEPDLLSRLLSSQRQEHWTAHPGLVGSAGNLVSAMGLTTDAIGMYALSLAARPEQWRGWLALVQNLLLAVCSSPSRAEAQLVRAAACATCLFAPPSHRTRVANCLLQRLRLTGLLFDPATPGLSTQASSSNDTKLSTRLPYPLLYVLICGALGGPRAQEARLLQPKACEDRLTLYATQASQLSAGATTEAGFRSVRTL